MLFRDANKDFVFANGLGIKFSLSFSTFLSGSSQSNSNGYYSNSRWVNLLDQMEGRRIFN